MTNTKLVLDANIIIKLFHKEPDTDVATNLLKYLLQNDIPIIAPQLLITESMDVCIAKRVDTKILIDFFEAQLNNSLHLVDLDVLILNKACELVKTGHPKSGYPSFNDCIYHAVAIVHDAILFTADKRHYQKTKAFGCSHLFSDWERVLGDG